jgi:hypothetical protein
VPPKALRRRDPTRKRGQECIRGIPAVLPLAVGTLDADIGEGRGSEGHGIEVDARRERLLGHRAEHGHLLEPIVGITLQAGLPSRRVAGNTSSHLIRDQRLIAKATSSHATTFWS